MTDTHTSIADYAHHGEDAKWYWLQEQPQYDEPADYEPWDDDDIEWWD